MTRSKVKISEQSNVGDGRGALPSTDEESAPEPVSGDLCQECKTPTVVIRLNIDGYTLLMQSCETCDIRSWNLRGETIDRQSAISEVGDSLARRR